MVADRARAERDEFLRNCERIAAREKWEPPPEPELWNRTKLEREQKLAQELHLAGGSVRKAVTREGDGSVPNEKDEVVYHITGRAEHTEGNPFMSSRAEDGGRGVPFRFVLSDKCKILKGLELCIGQMREGEHAQIQLKPSYAYSHPTTKERGLRLPEGVSDEAMLYFDVEIIAVYLAKVITEDQLITKVVTEEGRGWETPRPPFDVKVEVAASVLLPDHKEKFFKKRVIEYSSGAAEVPPALDAAVNSMRQGESAVVWCAAEKASETPTSSSSEVFPVPPHGGAPDGIEYELRLLKMVHVRDVFGDGEVCKRREVVGEGEFPADCPINDCRVRIHYRLRKLRGGETLYDTREDPELAGSPFECHLGCAELPPGLETSVRLMIPKETSVVTLVDAASKYGYSSAPDAPGAAHAPPAGCGLEWEVVLEGFDTPVNWHKADLKDMMAEAVTLKEEGNSLLKSGQVDLALKKYEKVYHNLDGLRGLDQEEYVDVWALKRTALLNMAAALQRKGEHAACMGKLHKVLREEPECVKALWRRSVSLLATHEFAAAREDLATVEELDPSLSKDVIAQLAKVKAAEGSALGKERREFGGILHGNK